MKKTQEQFIRMMMRGEGSNPTPHRLSRPALDAIFHHLNDNDFEEAGYPVTKARVAEAFWQSGEDYQCQLWGCKDLAALQELTWAERIGEDLIVFERNRS